MTQPTTEQTWDAEGYVKNAAFVAELGEPLLQLLAPQSGEHILDLGCGDGRLTEKLTQSGATVTGLEPAPSFVVKSRERGLNVIQQDAHDPFGAACYDAVFSNAALHWMKAPETVIANVSQALKPGGRFVAEQGGAGNVKAIIAAISHAFQTLDLGPAPQNPWDFPAPEEQTARLKKAGFRVVYIELIPRPTPLPTGITGWLRTFAQPFFSGLRTNDMEAVLRHCEDYLTDTLQHSDGSWFADYVRLRFHAQKL